MKLFITAILLTLFNPLSIADIHKCQDADGHVYYHADDEKRPDKCVTTSNVVIRSLTDAERSAIIRKDREKYREKVRATAQFLDDVEALRNK